MSDCQGETVRRARKAHRCEECRGSIVPGELYTYVSGVWDGCPDSWRMCSACTDVMHAWYRFARAEQNTPEDWSRGEMWESIQFWIDERPFILAERERVEARKHYSTTQVWATQPRSW